MKINYKVIVFVLIFGRQSAHNPQVGTEERAMMQSRKNGDGRRDSVQVFLAMDAKPEHVGVFRPGHGERHAPHAFAYASSWLKDEAFFNLDPHIQPCEGEQFPPPPLPMFGMLRDATPDRWGRMLLAKTEAVAAEVEGRPVRKLDDADYLLAVEDVIRVGAMRLCRDEGVFLKEGSFPAPVPKDLRCLADISLHIDMSEGVEHPEYRSRLARLVSASAALGGARPKANFLDASSQIRGATQLWIAKFPASNDEHDVGGWEFLLNQLARKAGIVVPNAKLLRVGGSHSTFCVERFDRRGSSRMMYASAMTCLQRQDGDDDVGYPDIAGFIVNHAARDKVQGQLEQLFRRVIFNVLVGNRDDHLRNHAFLYGAHGWELAPAYDVNPNPRRQTHAIRLDDASAVPDIDRVMATAEAYQLSRNKAAVLLDEVASAIASWHDEAVRLGLLRREIQMMEGTFVVNAA
jgi:serine/threonine-protein kinase HipA